MLKPLFMAVLLPITLIASEPNKSTQAVLLHNKAAHALYSMFLHPTSDYAKLKTVQVIQDSSNPTKSVIIQLLFPEGVDTKTMSDAVAKNRKKLAGELDSLSYSHGTDLDLGTIANYKTSLSQRSIKKGEWGLVDDQRNSCYTFTPKDSSGGETSKKEPVEPIVIPFVRTVGPNGRAGEIHSPR